jgi:hypothetical protein
MMRKIFNERDEGTLKPEKKRCKDEEQDEDFDEDKEDEEDELLFDDII